MEKKNFHQKYKSIFIILFFFILASRLQYFLTKIPAYSNLYNSFEFYLPETIKSILEITLVLIAAIFFFKHTFVDAIKELGVKKPTGILVAAAVLSTVPLWIGFAVTSNVRSDISILSVIYLAVISPFAEEIVFRGFAFGWLYKKASLGFWTSVLLTAFVFGIVHIEKASNPQELLGIFLITFVGGAFFSWFYMKWGLNIFAPFIVHALMNLSWQIFDAGDTAFAGWLPTALQATVLLTAILITIKLRGRKMRE